MRFVLWIVMLGLTAPSVMGQVEDLNFRLETTRDLYTICVVGEDHPQLDRAVGVCLGYLAGVLEAYSGVVVTESVSRSSRSGRAGRHVSTGGTAHVVDGAVAGATAGAISGFILGTFADVDPLATAIIGGGIGAATGVVAGSAVRPESGIPPEVCLPRGVPRIEVAEAFLDWAEANPYAATAPPAGSVLRALMTRWPCR